MRIILALEVHVTKALLDVVHNRNNDPSYQGLSENDVDLYNYLKKNHNSILQQLLKLVVKDGVENPVLVLFAI